MTLDASSGSSETAERLKDHNEWKVWEREARFARGWERGRSGLKPTGYDVDSARADSSVGLVSLVTGTACVADVGAIRLFHRGDLGHQVPRPIARIPIEIPS
jgi:hypothetical protein